MKPTHKMYAGRWKSASAFVLIPLMISASGGTLSSTSVADVTTIPHVPSTPYDQPASVQPAVTVNASPVTAIEDVKAIADLKEIAEVATIDIPGSALLAYHRTETLLSDADPDCKLPWTLVAAIGRIESDHGRTGGNSLDDDGVARPGIYGIPLDGSQNTARIHDTDDGKLDRDERWDRAVGPMQFIPSTWASVAIDSDNDGKSDPQNILDAAAAAGVYLCAGVDDLATNEGAREAIRRYNHSDSYVASVLAIAKQYANGTFTDLPSSFFAATPLQAGIFPAAPVEAKGNKQDATTGKEPQPGTRGRQGAGSRPGTVLQPGTAPTNPIPPEDGSNFVPEADTGSEPVAPEPDTEPVAPAPEAPPVAPVPEAPPAVPEPAVQAQAVVQKVETQTVAPEPASPPVEEDPPPPAATEPDAEI